MSEVAALVIQPDGSIQELPDVKYETLKAAVGGWLEGVTFDADAHGFCDEEGKLKGLPYNEKATRLYNNGGGYVDVICGPLVVTGGTDEDGETQPIEPRWIEKVRSL